MHILWASFRIVSIYSVIKVVLKLSLYVFPTCQVLMNAYIYMCGCKSSCLHIQWWTTKSFYIIDNQQLQCNSSYLNIYVISQSLQRELVHLNFSKAVLYNMRSNSTLLRYIQRENTEELFIPTVRHKTEWVSLTYHIYVYI